ncbi:MAG: tetratricopeptide repeat protein [Nostoc sp.]|uniref:tetratricopeptide repeat protein n=1 Tax=Nostoc sp. TaxID=1180 RepID=UPI002FFD2654
MPLKPELLKFLSRMLNTQTVPQRKALLAAVGFDRLGRQITWEGTNLVFFNELLELLRSEGQSNLERFLRNLADRDLDLVGLEDSLKLVQFAENICALTREAWEREFWGVSNTKASSHIPFVLPQSDTPNFTGREEQLQQLEALLLNSQGSKVCSIVGVSGGGGIGKSALACRFATIHQDKFPDGVIGLRVDGKDVDTIAREFVRRCGEELDSEDERDAATLMQEVFTHRKMLLIFDNAEEAIIKKLRPGGTRCAVIVTTRKRNLSFSLDIGEQETIDLPPLPEADALKLLKKILGDERVENAVAATKRLVKLVGNLPLALQVLGAALRGQREPLDDYTKALEEEKDELFEELKVEGDRDLNVEVSLNLSLKSLSEDEVDFFACLSVCAAEGFTKQTAMPATGCERNLQAQRCLKKLYDLSLLNYVDSGENRFVLHPLVRVYAEALARKRGLLAVAQERHAKFFVEWLQSDELRHETTIAEVAANLDDVILAAQWLQTHEADTAQSKMETYQFALKLQPLFEQYGYWQKAITLMTQFQSWAELFEDWNAVVRYKMHEARYWSFAEEFERAEEILGSAQACLQKIENLDTQKRREAKVLNVLGGVFQKQGKTEEAIHTFRDEILIEEEIGDDRSLGIVCNRLGKLLQSQGKLEEAQQAFERGIVIVQAINDQSSLAIGLNCLGGLLQQQGKLKEAQQAFEQEIVIDEALNDQSKLAIGLNRLGGLLQQQGKLDKAQQAFERQIAIAQALNDQSSLAIGLNCLGGLLQQQGKLEQAQQAFERGIAIAQALNDQSSLAIGLNRLGGLLQQQGKLEQAQQAFEREIAIDEALNHQSQLAIGLNRLGGLLQQQGKLEEALVTAKRCVAIETELGVSRGLTIALTQVSQLLKAAGQVQKAITTFENIAQIEEELGNQRGLAMTLSSLASLQRDHGDFDEASNTLLRIFAIEKSLNNQERMLWTLNSLSYVALQQEKFDLAIEYYEHAVELSKDYGNEEVSASILNGMGIALHQYGNFLLEQQTLVDKALEVLKRSQKVFIHLNISIQVAWVLHSLGRAWKLKGKFEKAEILLKRSQEIFEDKKDLPSLAKVLNTLGGVLEKQQKWNEAEKILRQSYDLAEKLKDKRGQAIIANSLGQVIAHQEREKAFELSQMYFRQSIKLGEELDEQQHLAKVHTAMGQAFLAHEVFDRAVEELSKGFEIDESLSNIRGLRIVIPNLTYALIKLGKREEALEYCDRALIIDPNSANFLRLRDKI